jgi:hypothetical protein
MQPLQITTHSILETITVIETALVWYADDRDECARQSSAMDEVRQHHEGRERAKAALAALNGLTDVLTAAVAVANECQYAFYDASVTEGRTCSEANALAALLRSIHGDAAGRDFLDDHSDRDEDGDDPDHLERKQRRNRFR